MGIVTVSSTHSNNNTHTHDRTETQAREDGAKQTAWQKKKKKKVSATKTWMVHLQWSTTTKQPAPRRTTPPKHLSTNPPSPLANVVVNEMRDERLSQAA